MLYMVHADTKSLIEDGLEDGDKIHITAPDSPIIRVRVEKVFRDAAEYEEFRRSTISVSPQEQK